VPLEARISAVADVWDALTSDRVYRKAMSHAEAQAILISERGTKLDGDCVDALLAVVGRAVIAAEDAVAPFTRSLAAAG
jgi:HD-GYP domain-containing protein (c-di-GMP phosphodiesterase class II)